jgi:hypothetical protein
MNEWFEKTPGTSAIRAPIRPVPATDQHQVQYRINSNQSGTQAPSTPASRKQSQ